jgi:hypothetical protein
MRAIRCEYIPRSGPASPNAQFLQALPESIALDSVAILDRVPLRRIAEKGSGGLLRNRHAIDTFTSAECANYFAAAGYDRDC